jgi:hypothetical protein
LSRACAGDTKLAMWEPAGWDAKRQAGNLAVAIDGLTARCATELNADKAVLRELVAKLCVWPGTADPRPGCIERVQAVANAYRHGELRNRTMPISSDRDVLAVGIPFGIDAFGMGKCGGVEVPVRDKGGRLWVCLADATAAVATLTTTEIYTRGDPTEKLDAMESIVPPHLRRGAFQPADRLIALLQRPS